MQDEFASMTFLTIAVFGVVLLCAGLMSLFFNLSISLPANECTGRQRRNSVSPDQDFTAAIGDAALVGKTSVLFQAKLTLKASL